MKIMQIGFFQDAEYFELEKLYIRRDRKEKFSKKRRKKN